MREVLGGLADEGAGVRVGHARCLVADRGGDALVAVAETGDGGAAGAVDDLGAVGEMQVDAVAAGGGGRDGTGAMQNAAGHYIGFPSLLLHALPSNVLLGSFGSRTLRAVSAPATGRPRGSSLPICTSTEA